MAVSGVISPVSYENCALLIAFIHTRHYSSAFHKRSVNKPLQLFRLSVFVTKELYNYCVTESDCISVLHQEHEQAAK